jgi:hypothetical protein
MATVEAWEIVDGEEVEVKHTVKVGDCISFKSDTEQDGICIGIKGKELKLENEGGFRGDYIGGETVHYVYASDCWFED